MKKRWITFDLDGTLMQNPFVEWVFPEIELTVLEKATGELDVLTAMISEHNKRMNENLIFEAYDWDDILNQFLLQNKIELDINIQDLVKKHSIIPKVHLLEDHIIEDLTRLKEQGYCLAVATNGYFKYQSPVLDALGLSELFDLVLTPEEAGYAKPNVKMIESLSANEKIVAHVGDRIDHDVNLANQLGIPSVFIYRKLPDSLKQVHPFERRNEPICIKLCEEKWEKETKGERGPFTKSLVPDIVIDSMKELEGCMNCIMD